MTDKDLIGCWKKDAKFRQVGQEGLFWPHYAVGKDMLVPVRLKSESVGIEWLEDYCKRNKHPVGWDGTDGKYHEEDAITIENLLTAAKKKAKEVERDG